MERDCTIYVAKTKTLISFAVTEKLIYASLFSHMQNVGFLMTRLKLFLSCTCYNNSIDLLLLSFKTHIKLTCGF